MSESIVFLVLALVWVGYLVIWWRDSRRITTRRTDRISFGRQLSTLGNAAGGALGGSSLVAGMVPRSRAAAAQRRRDVLVLLSVLVVITLLGAIAFGPVLLLLHVVVDLALAAYAYACVQRRNEAAEREMKVTMLYPERPSREGFHRARPARAAARPAHRPAPVAPLRQTVNG